MQLVLRGEGLYDAAGTLTPIPPHTSPPSPLFATPLSTRHPGNLGRKKIRQKLMDCLETASFPGQPTSEVDRLLHMVVVGGGPTGVEYAAELRDFLVAD